MKDPAFLFYSKDFYEGTRTMLPEERACYMDLLIYQHQHGIIPLDLRRVLMYCSGVDQATLQAVLETKFERRSNGYTNARLTTAIEERESYKTQQSINGRISVFYRKAKKMLSPEEYKQLKALALEKEDILEILDTSTDSETLLASFKRRLNIYAIANAIAIVDVNEIENKEKGVQGEKKSEPKNIRTLTTAPPTSKPAARPSTIAEVTTHFTTLGLSPQSAAHHASEFWDYYQSNGWKVGGKAPMKDWKAAAANWKRRRESGEFSAPMSAKAMDKRAAVDQFDYSAYKKTSRS